MFLIMDTQVDLLRDRQADLKRPNLVKHLPETKSCTMESAQWNLSANLFSDQFFSIKT